MGKINLNTIFGSKVSFYIPRHTWFVYIQFLISSSSPLTVWSKAALKGIKEEEFSACFEQWKHRMEKCIQSGGNYFEGDKLSDTAA